MSTPWFIAVMAIGVGGLLALILIFLRAAFKLARAFDEHQERDLYVTIEHQSDELEQLWDLPARERRHA